MTRDRIKEVALQLFAQRGYAETSLADIARQVGIQKSTIYAHFASKEDLFLAVFGASLRDYVAYVEHLSKQTAGEALENRLRDFLRETCYYYLRHEDSTALLKRAMLFPPAGLTDRLRAQFLQSEEQTTRVLTAIFDEGLASGLLRSAPLQDLLAAYYCLNDGLFLQLFYYEEEHFAGKFASAWRIFWSGISV